MARWPVCDPDGYFVCGQKSVKPPDTGPSAAVGSRNGPFHCPGSASCGSYYTLNTQACDIDNAEYCVILDPIFICNRAPGCTALPSYTVGDPCIYAKMKDRGVRSRILELAKDNEVLVPTCGGGYVPAELLLRERPEKKDDNL